MILVKMEKKGSNLPQVPNPPPLGVPLRKVTLQRRKDSFPTAKIIYFCDPSAVSTVEAEPENSPLGLWAVKCAKEGTLFMSPSNPLDVKETVTGWNVWQPLSKDGNLAYPMLIETVLKITKTTSHAIQDPSFHESVVALLQAHSVNDIPRQRRCLVTNNVLFWNLFFSSEEKRELVRWAIQTIGGGRQLVAVEPLWNLVTQNSQGIPRPSQTIQNIHNVHGFVKRPRDQIALPSCVLQIIQNVQGIVTTVTLNKNQCKRIADRFKGIGAGLKGMEEDFVSGKLFDGSNVDYPASDELLTVLRKGEALVSSYRGEAAIYTVLSRTDNREAFKEIHEELDTMKGKFPFEEAYFELIPRHERSVILTNDAEKDLEEMKDLKALEKSADGLSSIDEVTQLSEKLGAMNLEKVKKVVFEKSEYRQASDSLPSYLNIDMAEIEIDTRPTREHLKMSMGDQEQTFSWKRVRPGRWLGCGFAVKVFKSGESSWDRSELAREVGNVMELRHPHIVRFIGFAQGVDQCCVLKELMDSDLKTFMMSRPRPPFSHSEELSIITQIAKGMLYLHTKGYVHEDLNCSNILVKSYGDYIEVKIGDLRNARKLASIGDQYSSHCSRRPGRTALEAIKNYKGEKPSDEMLRKSDVYCFAMTCYEVVTGKLLFQDIRGRALMAMIEADERPDLPADLDEGLRGLITTCWDSDSSKRPEFEDICHVLGIIRSSKPHVASNGKLLGTESKMLRLLKQGSLNTWVIPRVTSAVSGLFAGVQSKQQAATKTPVVSQEETVENMPVVSQEESVENMDVDGRSGIRIPEYLRIKPAALHKGRCIGSGASAEVWEVMWLGCKFAMKTFQFATDSGPIRWLQSELDFLIQLHHPYIIQMVGLSVDFDQRCSIVMEFMGGSLRKLIRSRMDQKRAVPFDVHEALGIIRKIALGMAFLHSRGVLHRHLKGENVLCQEYADSIDVKIVDFGVSQFTEGNFSLRVGTRFGRAPEIFPPFSNSSRTWKADVYSFAMTCYEVLTGNVPFADLLSHNDYNAVPLGLRPELPLDLDSGLKALIAKCWQTDPEERPHFSQICDELRTIHQTLNSSNSTSI